MKTVIVNAKESVSNTAEAASSLLLVTTEVTADVTSLVAKCVKHLAPTTRALAMSPFDAATGYLMESEGITLEAAEERSHKYLNLKPEETIKELAMSLGALMAEEPTKEPETKPVRKAKSKAGRKAK